MRPGSSTQAVSRRTRPQNSKTNPPKAPAPEAGGTGEGSSITKKVSHKKPEGVPGMKPKEAKLAGYLMARAATNKKVEGRDLKHLRAGNDTVREVSELLPLGRANVSDDIEKAKDVHIPLRMQASKKLASDLMTEIGSSAGEVTETDFYRVNAAAAIHAQTGTCGSYAAITNPLHATKLADMKDTRAIVAQVMLDTMDHGWSESIPKGTRRDGTPNLSRKDVIMDGWCKEGLAVLREDSQFARKARHLQHMDVLDSRTGPDAKRAVEGFKSRIDESVRLQYSYRRSLKKLRDAKVEIPKDSVWEPQSILSASFRQQAGKALHPKAPSAGEASSSQGAKVEEKQVGRDGRQAKRNSEKAGREADPSRQALMAEIQAVGVSRSLGANIPGAVAEAPRILASAKDLFPGPRE